MHDVVAFSADRDRSVRRNGEAREARLITMVLLTAYLLEAFPTAQEME